MTKEVLALPYECWRWIPGYEGLYQVSTRGRVRSVDRWVTCKDGSKTGSKRFRRGRILKTTRDKGGYLCLGLHHDGKIRTFKVHRLVAMAWIDNPENKPEVNHLDENPGNPDVFNLSWASRIENANWGTRNKRQAESMLNGKLSKPVQAIDPETGIVVKEFPSAKEAGRNGFCQTHVSACCRGEKKYKTHRGLVWRYKES